MNEMKDFSHLMYSPQNLKHYNKS